MQTFHFDNPVICAIRERTSTRSYKSEQITQNELETILSCAIASPSAQNAQPWHFTVVQDKKLLQEMNSDIHAAIQAYGDDYTKAAAKDGFNFFFDAPTVIFVSGEQSKRWYENDCGIASSSAMLSAHSLGMGSCIIGYARRLFDCELGTKYLQKLEVPEGYKLLFGITLGYIDQPTPVRSRRQDVVSTIR